MNRSVLICAAEEETVLLQKVLVETSENPDGSGRKGFFCQPVYFHNPGLLLKYFREKYAENRRIPLCILEISGNEDRDVAENLIRTDPDVQILMLFPRIFPQSDNKRPNTCTLNLPLREDCILALLPSLLCRWNDAQALKNRAPGPETVTETGSLSASVFKEDESYLKTVLATVPAAVMIIDPETYKIMDANPCASAMLGCPEQELIGRDFYELRDTGADASDPEQRIVSDEYTLKRDNEELIHVRRTLARARVQGREYLVQSMLDITDIRQLMKKLEISIDLAKHLLQMINGLPPRHTFLSKNRLLFAEVLSYPYYKEGGDHFFVRNFSDEKEGKTVISLKDQSGHEVGCVLRSIITDLIHHSLLNRYPSEVPEKIISRLNEEICRSGLFQAQDFFTSVSAEICHKTLELRYVSAGHPRFLLIRGDEVMGLPERSGEGKNLFIPVHPGSEFSAGTFSLREGDKLIFYTDGLTEMPRTGNIAFLTFEGIRKLTADIVRHNRRLSVSELIRRLSRRIADMSNVEIVPFIKNTSLDDITILGLEIESRDCEQRILFPEDSDMLYRMIADLYREIFKGMQERGYEISGLGIRSVLAESILNAWRHGNRQDSSKSVTVCWRYGNDFHLEVRDEGSGFDVENIPDPKKGDFFYRSSGRGIFIIRRYSHRLCWKDRGRCLIISIRKHQEPSVQEYARQSEKTIKLW